MKPTLFKLGKWSMTTIAALILSACGSSGDDAPSTKGQTTPNNGASTSSTPSKENYALKAANALKEAQAAKMEADKAAAAGDVAAAQAAVAKAQAAANAAQEAAVKANNDKDPNAPAAVSAAQQAAEALQTLANAVADAQKVADQKLAENQKQDNTLKATQALEAAKAAQAAAEKAVATGDVAAAKAAAEKAKAAVEAAKAVAGKDTKATDLQTLAQQAADALKAVENAVAEAQKVADQKLAQDTANESITVSTVPVNNKTSNVGYQHTQKIKSDLRLGNAKTTANSAANTALLMQEQKLNPHLNTFVVAHFNEDGKDAIIYLQDLDIKTAKKVADKDTHKVELEDVLLPTPNSTAKPAIAERSKTDDPLVGVTKTTEKGTGKASALVYTQDQRIYIDQSGFAGNPTKVSAAQYDAKGKTPAAVEKNLIDRTDTVFESYGAKTTFAKTEGSNPEAYQAGVTEANAKNLPLLDKTLKYVQYGRVTSQVSGRDLEDFLKGLKQGPYDTLITPYGQYGKEGTENHYFSRGTNNTTAEQVANLSTHYGNDNLTYEGHAVGYNLKNDYIHTASGKVPNALGGSVTPYLVSGNHFRANVNLNTKDVIGSVYNTWVLATDGVLDKNSQKVEAQLVGFKGTLAPNGNIAGTAENYTQNYAPGIFNATLFGSKAEEMGGTIVSANPEKLQWGVSFGAINTTGVKPAAVKPPPAPTKVGGSSLGAGVASDNQDRVKQQ